MRHTINILVLIILSSGILLAKEKTVRGTIILKNDSVIDARIIVPLTIVSSPFPHPNDPLITVYTKEALVIDSKGRNKLINFPILQKKIVYYTEDNVKVKLKAKDIKEVKAKFTRNINRLVFIEIKSPPPFAFKKQLLLPVASDKGRMKHYLYFKDKSAGHYISVRDFFYYNVLLIDSNDPFIPDWFNDFKSITKYVGECKNLVKRIENGTLSLPDMHEIVNEFNNCEQ